MSCDLTVAAEMSLELVERPEINLCVRSLFIFAITSPGSMPGAAIVMVAGMKNLIAQIINRKQVRADPFVIQGW